MPGRLGRDCDATLDEYHILSLTLDVASAANKTCLEAAFLVRMQVLWNGPERALRVSSRSVDIAIVEQESSNCCSVCAYACFRRQDDATEQAWRLVVVT